MYQSFSGWGDFRDVYALRVANQAFTQDGGFRIDKSQ
jgi:hypothetical protein